MEPLTERARGGIPAPRRRRCEQAESFRRFVREVLGLGLGAETEHLIDGIRTGQVASTLPNEVFRDLRVASVQGAPSMLVGVGADRRIDESPRTVS